jgi:hypothetical protein
VTAVQSATPETASVPLNVIGSGVTYHSPLSGTRPGATVTAGGVASYFSVYGDDELELPAWSVHVPEMLVDAVSGPE